MRMSWLVLPLALSACNMASFRGDLPGEPSRNANPVEVQRVTDSHVQVSPLKADILFVISNWWSSDRLTDELIEAFDDMLFELIDSGVDYHIGVISTDTDHADDNGKLREGFGDRWIDIENSRPLLAFAQMATMDASGCVGPRRPRDATYMALEHQANTHNLGFRRPEATMHTIFVNDDTDESYRMSFDEWVEWYDDFGPRPEVDSLSTIVDYQLDSENLVATQLIGGASHDIRDLPWENVMKDIGLRARGPKSEFMLSRVPVLDTLEVLVRAPTGISRFELGEHFSYIDGRNTILFDDYQPPSGSKVEISYEPM